MAKKRILKNFTENLAIYTKDLLTDVQKVRIAKNTYILNNYEELIKAHNMGYTYRIIAEYMTTELIKTNIPKTFIGKNSLGDEIEVKTKIHPEEIKNIIENK